MNGKGDRPRAVDKEKYDVRYDLMFNKCNPYTDEQLDEFISKGYITENCKAIFKSKYKDKLNRL